MPVGRKLFISDRRKYFKEYYEKHKIEYQARYLKKKYQEKVDKEYWFSPPQHLNYFNTKNLRKFFEKTNLNIIDAISDFPIEMYLWGNKKNYVKDKSLGPYAHQARIAMELLISKNSFKDIINFYRSLYKIGFGRNQIVIAKRN